MSWIGQLDSLVDQMAALWWVRLLGLLALIVAPWSAVHAIVHKRDPAGQMGWTTLCLLVPLLGPLFYYMFGTNRIRMARDRSQLDSIELRVLSNDPKKLWSTFEEQWPDGRTDEAQVLGAIGDRVTPRPLLGGNRIIPLFQGDEAYPAMLHAIDEARDFICLQSYIFDTDVLGHQFIDALVEARGRGVEVMVLVDAIGERYARPHMSKVLLRLGVTVVRYLPPGLSRNGTRFNLRNHRKVLVVDGNIGFTGGMNIGSRHLLRWTLNTNPTADIHFRLEGPVVHSLLNLFRIDWEFSTGKPLILSPAPAVYVAQTPARCIASGPDATFQDLLWVLVGVIASARRSVRILTPYFIPGPELTTALCAAALRGTSVQIIVPRISNVPPVNWAMQGLLDPLLEFGVEVYYQPPPFDHTKLLLVDGYYVNLGSCNLDPRSLDLNFELNVEVFDPDLHDQLADHFANRLESSDRLTPEFLASRSRLAALRDDFCRIFSPYL